jgi:hypothetical protein
VTNRTDAKLLQVVRREIWQDRLVYLILAECRLVLPEAQAPQPDHNVHDGAPTIGVAHIIFGGSEGVQGVDGVLRASQSMVRSNGNGGCLPAFLKSPGGGRNLEIAGKRGPYSAALPRSELKGVRNG